MCCTWGRRDRALGRTQNSEFHREPAAVFGGCKVRRSDFDAAYRGVACAERGGNTLEGTSFALARARSQRAGFSCV